ncbi:MFS transporter superfamily [Babesia duncani]|uniref:MFS transporter superfamily n=1 Tax=Babesia duncani TaxID=323732 RepID=A0AAD9PIF5_9APIC|nr:MFS transporter superfamily [Babesia duncani]
MKINWYLRVAIYCTFAILAGSYYDGWTATTGVLVRAGLYENYCSEDEIKAQTERHLPKCDAQMNAISGLISIFRVAEFLSSVIWGIVLDLWGPKVTMSLGMLERIASWIVLVYWTGAGPIAAAILCGISTNAIILPLYTITAYDKKKLEIGMCLLSIALSIGAFYPLILNLILDGLSKISVSTIVMFKLAFTHLPLLLLTPLVFPMKLTDDGCNQTLDDTPNTWTVKGFIKEMCKPKTLIIIGLFTINCVSLTFGQETFPVLYDGNETALYINSIMLPCSSIFSLIFMFVIKKYGSVLVITILNGLGGVMHASMLSSTTIASIFASIAMSMAYSGFITFFFIYLEIVVDVTYSASAKGFASSVGGIAFLINLGLNQLTSSSTAMVVSHVTFIVLRILMFAPCLYLMKK